MRETTGLDLQRIIEDSIRSARDLAVEIPVRVVAEYPAHLPSVEFLREDLTGILTSLITSILLNTIHMEVRVRASLITAEDVHTMQHIPVGSRPGLDDSGPWIFLEVSDTNAGTLQLTNDMFIEATVFPKAAGDELLSISECRDILEESGGKLWVEHQPEIGSRCSLFLTLHAIQQGQKDRSVLYRAVETHLPEQKGEARTLLILSDNPGMRSALPADLVQGGYRVLTTGDSSEFLKLTRSEKAELLLLDIELRDPPAFDIAMLLKADPKTKSIPILFLTALRDQTGQTLIGAVDFLSRPVGTGKLHTIVEDFLDTRRKAFGRVLVIEPDDSVRSTLVLKIRARGERVTEASGPEEALVLAERFPPGMVLINANTACEGDYWLLRQLRRLSSEMQILVLANQFSEKESIEVMHRGASRYGETGRLPDLLDDSP